MIFFYFQGDINEKDTMRETLYTNWASLGKWYRYQPLDYVKEYFGVKIGKSVRNNTALFIKKLNIKKGFLILK